MFTAEELLQLINTIYAGMLDPTAWQAAITGLCSAFGGERAALALQDRNDQHVESATYVGIDRNYQDAYAQLTRQPDMRGAFQALGTSLVLGAMTGDEIGLVATDFGRSRFYAEWLGKQDVLDFVAVPLAPTSTLVGALFIGRPRRGRQYGNDELDAARMLRPHVLRATQVRLRLDAAEAFALTALAALDQFDQGIVLVDAAANVLHANRAAEAALAQGDGLRADRIVLACDRPDDTAALRRLVGHASTSVHATGGILAARRRSGRRPLSVLVAPLRGERPSPGPSRRATAMVLVADPEAAVPSAGEAVAAAYGLTAAEARIAAALLDHTRLADIAEALNVSLATVRTLLQRAFDKTDTHSQSELVQLMLAHRLPGGTKSQS